MRYDVSLAASCLFLRVKSDTCTSSLLFFSVQSAHPFAGFSGKTKVFFATPPQTRFARGRHHELAILRRRPLDRDWACHPGRDLRRGRLALGRLRWIRRACASRTHPNVDVFRFYSMNRDLTSIPNTTQVSPEEVTKIVAGMDDPAGLQAGGVHLGGHKFMFIQSDDRMVAGKKVRCSFQPATDYVCSPNVF